MTKDPVLCKLVIEDLGPHCAPLITCLNLFFNLEMFFFFSSKDQVRKILLYISTFKDHLKNISISVGNT